MEITLVLAMDEAGLIGAGGDLPWRLPADLRRFRQLTMGHTIVMGRATYASIGHPLEGRENWVLSGDPAFSADGVRVFHDTEAVLHAAPERGLMIIGGASIYATWLSKATRIALTRVHARLPGDTWFPDPTLDGWKAESLEVFPPDARHSYAYSFLSLVPR